MRGNNSSVVGCEMMLENTPYDDIRIGDTAELSRCLSFDDIRVFAAATGDVNPAHLDPDFASHDMFHRIVAHGMWGGALISAVLGTRLPGPGTVYLEQNLSFLKPVFVGDTVTASVCVSEKMPRGRVRLACRCTNQNGEDVIKGTAVVIAPDEKIRIAPPPLPRVALGHIDEGGGV